MWWVWVILQKRGASESRSTVSRNVSHWIKGTCLHFSMIYGVTECLRSPATKKHLWHPQCPHSKWTMWWAWLVSGCRSWNGGRHFDLVLSWTILFLTTHTWPPTPHFDFGINPHLQFDFDLTSICFPTFKTIRTSLITQLPVAAHPVGSPWSPHQEESKTTMHICTLMA